MKSSYTSWYVHSSSYGLSLIFLQPGAQERKRSIETIDDPLTQQLGPQKRSKRSSDVLLGRKTGDIYHHFQLKYQADFSQATFLGICAYLYTLIRWEYQIPVSAFDNFLCSHSTFVHDLDGMVSPPPHFPAYHHWFTKHKLHESQSGEVLDGDSLYDIATEHPYTFAYTEASMELIAKKARDGDSLIP